MREIEDLRGTEGRLFRPHETSKLMDGEIDNDVVGRTPLEVDHQGR